MPLTYDQFMQKTNGKGTMGTFNVYRPMRKFTMLMRECSSRLFEQLMTDRDKANNPDIENDPAYKAKDSVMQITESLASTSNVVPIDFGEDATDKQKETWTNNVNAVIDDVKKLMEPDNFKAFVDFALNSDDPDMATLPAQLQHYIELINQHFEAGIDPELFATRYTEYAKDLDGKNEEKAEEKAGEKIEENKIEEEEILVGENQAEPEKKEEPEKQEGPVNQQEVKQPFTYASFLAKNNGQDLETANKEAHDTLQTFREDLNSFSSNFLLAHANDELYPFGMMLEGFVNHLGLLNQAGRGKLEEYEQQFWMDERQAVIDSANELLKAENFNKFMDATLNSQDGKVQQLPAMFQKVIGVLNENYGADIDPGLYAKRVEEYSALELQKSADQEDLDINRINALDIEEFDRRDAFLEELNGIAQGLNARHRGDITGLFSGDSKLMQNLKSAIKDYNDYVKHPFDDRFLGKREEDILNRIVETSDAYYKARGFDPKTGNPVDLDSKSQMGRARLETAEKIMGSVKDRIAHIQHPEMDPDVKVDDTFIHRLETFKNGAESFQATHLANNGLVMITATAAMIEKYGGYASTKKYSEEYEAERSRLKNDETFIQMIDDLSPEEQLKKFNDPMGFYQEYLNKKQMELAPQAKEIVVQNKNVGGEAYGVENKIVGGEAYRPEKVQEIPFEQQKLDFADLAAETFLRHFHKQQVDAYVKQNPGTKPEQFSVEKYLSDNKETYMKEDENFLSFMDTIKDQPTLDKMKAKSPDELHQYYASGQFRMQAAPEQELIVENKNLGDGNVDLEAKIEVAQKQLKENVAKNHKYPNKKDAQQEYAAIATAHFVRSQQKSGEMLDMSDQGFEDLVKETVNSKPFSEVVRKYNDKEIYDKAIRDKGQDMYAALSTARKQYKEYLDAQKNGVQMNKSDPNLQQGGFQKK